MSYIGGWNVNIRIHDVVEALGELFARLDEVSGVRFCSSLTSDPSANVQCLTSSLSVIFSICFQEVGKSGPTSMSGRRRTEFPPKNQDVHDGCL